MRRRFRRRPSRTAWGCWLIGFAILLRWAWGALSTDPFSAELPLAEDGVAVVEVQDDFTILMEQPVFSPGRPAATRIAHVRLLGLRPLDGEREDSELKAKRASDFIQQFLARRSPTLRFDKRRIDRRGRFLAYVYVDGRLLNEELIRAGLAAADFHPGDSAAIEKRLRAAQREARRARRGLWLSSKNDVLVN